MKRIFVVLFLTAVARADDDALRRMTPSVVALADHEGFPAHAAALRDRPR